eukprot:TRINITY_DN465_c0_g4_i2.p1 TRINITY_DN465_c0_g4~~TRINITY_DN465_c0_g4_i2.p1  ORF type:complete len:175 (+),score=35.07 TRINITY_DN465_c0_g4_i2:474-998(+)
MGGAMAIHCAKDLGRDIVRGLIVLDVVEGTAMSSLPLMQSILRRRPKSFDSIPAAIQWSISTGFIRSRKSACVSVPPQIIETEHGLYVWRTDLESTSSFWEGWFTGMSELFLSIPTPKMLMIADTDRLDKALTIGQMQGKYQLTIMPAVGHQIQEDNPIKTAEKFLTFIERFQI